MIISPIASADEGYYITPDGMVLKAITVRTGLGYKWARVTMDGKQKSVFIHRLVARAYVPNPKNKPQVHHKNGDKFDNRAENLEWVTSGENTRYAHAHGLVSYRNQPIDMVDLEGHLIMTFSSEKEAAQHLKTKSSTGISRCLHGKQKTAYGYFWRSHPDI